MNHLELNQFQALLESKISDSERACFVDHLLECKECGTQFKTLHGLQEALQEPVKKRHSQIRYAIGVAAILFMALSPYLFHSTESKPPSAIQALAQNRPETTPAVNIAVHQEVLKVNYRAALGTWSQKKDVLSLVSLQNQPKSQNAPF